MSRITMVHGAGNDLWGPSSIKAKWFPALADGLAWHGVEVDEAEVRVAFYGDVFRPDPQEGYEPPVDKARALASVKTAMAGLDPAIDLDEVLKQLAEHHFDRLLAQAAAYIQQPEVRSAARSRVEAAIGPDTTVVIAHSLGTLVAYEALCAHPEWNVTDFVTVGCPLGADVVHPWLEPCPEAGAGVWPGTVERWTNIADARDPAAANSLVGKFSGTVTEYKVDNGHRVHDPEPYLNNRWTGQAVAVALTDGGGVG
jgi:pimeloyl-ACP methyl ester carboxylesterase